MKLEGKITEILPVRNVHTDRGDFKFVPIILEVLEDCHRYDGSLFVRENYLKIELSGRVADNFNLPIGANVIVDVKFSIYESGENRFQNIRSSYVVLGSTKLEQSSQSATQQSAQTSPPVSTDQQDSKLPF